MKTEKTEFILLSRLETIDEAALAASKIATESGIDESGLFGIDLAVREAVTNAVKHGNKFDETKRIKITFEKSPESLVIAVADEGIGFDWANLPDPTKSENLLKDSGRGILLMRSFMDDVSWKNSPTGGTIVRLTKRF